MAASPVPAPGAEPVPGTALLPRHYLDPALLALEQERIFARTWQLAGHVSQLPRPGAYLTAQAGTQPVLVVRGEDGALHAFRNVCRHRGSRLLAGSGQCKQAIRCRYHGWTYRLDGELIGIPEGRGFDTPVEKAAFGLHRVRVETLCGLVFVNVDPDAASLASLVGELAQRLARYSIPSLERFAEYSGEGQPANWKVVAENYLEGYHIPIAHPDLMRLLNYGNYTVEAHEHWVWFEAPLRARAAGNRLARTYARLVEPMPGLGPEDRRVWRYVFIYPNTAIDLYPDQVTTWQILPDGTARTSDVFGSYRPARSGPRTRLVQRLNQRVNSLVLREDVDLVENVQRGLASDGYECGPLGAREAGVAWLADRVRRDLA
jgi:choline monooxygenase